MSVLCLKIFLEKFLQATGVEPMLARSTSSMEDVF